MLPRILSRIICCNSSTFLYPSPLLPLGTSRLIPTSLLSTTSASSIPFHSIVDEPSLLPDPDPDPSYSQICVIGTDVKSVEDELEWHCFVDQGMVPGSVGVDPSLRDVEVLRKMCEEIRQVVRDEVIEDVPLSLSFSDEKMEIGIDLGDDEWQLAFENGPIDESILREEILQAVVLGSYSFPNFLDEFVSGESMDIDSDGEEISKKGIKMQLQLHISGEGEEDGIEHSPLASESGWIRAQAQNFARFLSDLPANILTPTEFCQFGSSILESIPESDCGRLKWWIRDEDWIAEERFAGLEVISRGSVESPRVFECQYLGAPSQDNNIIHLGLVGKGITFDAGGYSLKPSDGMKDMKGDMGGAAACLGAIWAIACLELPINVVVVTPLTENLISNRAIKPGDVYVSRNGLSVEVDNTDAEGRLILADALDYVSSDFEPEVLVDVATLTGAISIALGDVTGVFSSTNEGWEDVRDAFGLAGEECWRMPLLPKFSAGLASHVADLRNISDGREAGSSVAASFLKSFVSDSVGNYVHLDIAGGAISGGEGEMTGVSTRSLVKLAEILASKRDDEYCL